MSLKDILLATYIALSKLSKSKLLKALQSLREKYVELEATNSQLKAENAKLKEQLKSEKIKSVNKNANKPSSKQAEWEEKGVGNDGKGKDTDGDGEDHQQCTHLVHTQVAPDIAPAKRGHGFSVIRNA